MRKHLCNSLYKMIPTNLEIKKSISVFDEQVREVSNDKQ